MKQVSIVNALILSAAVLLFPRSVAAQQTDRDTSPTATTPIADAWAQQSNIPAGARQAEAAVERNVRRFGVGVDGAVALDPELLVFGAHGTFQPIFTRSVSFRPGLEFGVGELTTMFGINLDVLYRLPGGTSRWQPYVGAGPNFALSHRGFSVNDNTENGIPNRFDFRDTDFEGGVNVIAGARRRNGLFLEMKATAYGVSNVRLMFGFNF